MRQVILTALLLLCPFKVEAQDWFGPPLPCGQKRTGSQCAVLHAPGTNCDYERQYHDCLDRRKCFGDYGSAVDTSIAMSRERDTSTCWGADWFPSAPKISMGSLLVTMKDGTASWVSLDSLQAIYTDQVRRMIDSAVREEVAKRLTWTTVVRLCIDSTRGVFEWVPCTTWVRP